ncbi:hypothetical protein [Verrucosispora sp. SN26_14.1]|nr:hypothetical protein [Verrucosispora sp. SN26_14.1]
MGPRQTVQRAFDLLLDKDMSGTGGIAGTRRSRRNCPAVGW